MKDQPAIKQLVDRYLSWEKVEDRLARYKHIREHFDLRMLKNCLDKPPYYCHYFALRLGTWNDENLFVFFNDLLQNARSLKGWDGKKSQINSSGFDEFFGLLWELQMAKCLSSLEEVTEIEWLKQGPDLKVQINGECLYVECYTYRKSFGLELFIEDLLLLINKNLRVNHVPAIKFSLPQKPPEQENMLNQIFVPLLDGDYLKRIIEEASKSYPVILFQDKARNFYVSLEDADANTDNYMPELIPNASGDLEEYLKVAIKEAVKKKKCSNELKKNHPNLLAVNFLLSTDFQMARNRQLALNSEIPQQEFGNIDAIFLSVCGINEIPDLRDLRKNSLIYKDKTTHPLFKIIR